MLRSDNLKLKREVIELREFVKDLIGNFSGSRRGHSTETLTSLHPAKNVVSESEWQDVPRRTTNHSKNINSTNRFTISFTNRYNHLSQEGNECIKEYDNNDDDNRNNIDLTEIKTSTLQRRTLPPRRPSVVINWKPENQNLFNGRSTNTVPGNSSYKRITEHGKNTTILSDSIPKGIRMWEFNRHLNSGKAHIKPFPGATSKQLKHYALPTLEDDKPDNVIIHVGYNDISPINRNLEEVDVASIADEIVSIGNCCLEHGVSQVFISSLICNKYDNKQLLINRLNEQLKRKCIINGFEYIEHPEINIEHLWKDGVHLSEQGKIILAKDFINCLNSFLYKGKTLPRIT